MSEVHGSPVLRTQFVGFFFLIYGKLFYAQLCPSVNLDTAGSQRHAVIVPLFCRRVGVFLVLKNTLRNNNKSWKGPLNTVHTFQLVFLHALETSNL